MSTISPGRLLNVDDAADAIAVLETNMEILTEEIWGGAVTSAQVLTSSQTVTIEDQAEVYVLSNNIGTNDADCTITFDITGLPAVASRAVMVHIRAEKGVTAGSRTSQIDLEIDGSAIVSVPTGPGTAASTEDYSAMLSYNPLTGSWTLEQFGILPP
jgi:hypothetical protein